ERFVAAGHGDNVASLVELYQFTPSPVPKNPQSMSNTQVVSQGTDLVLQVTVAHKDKFGMWVITEHMRHGPYQNVGPFLDYHPPHEQHRRIEGAHGVTGLDCAGFDGLIESTRVDSVIDHPRLMLRHLVKPTNFVAQLVGHGNDPVRTIGAVAFV